MLLAGPIAFLVSVLLQIVSFAVLINALMSWFPKINRNSPFVKLVQSIAEPVCEPVRKLIPPSKTGNLDLSPLIVILAISLLTKIL